MLNPQLKDALEVGLIRPSHNEFGPPTRFVRKVDGSLRLCIEYRGLKEVTRKDAYPFPRVDDTLEELKDANFCTNIDLAFGFSQFRVGEEDVHKTTFHALGGLMQRVTIPFGLCNAPVTFQRMMNAILRGFIHKLVIVYPEDGCVNYSRTPEKYLEH
jgi:hypothetical protein